MSISLTRDRVQVTITRESTTLARVSFGVPLFIGTTDPDGPVAAAYADMDEVVAVYANTTPEYAAALAFFSQSPQPRRLIIGYKTAEQSYVQAMAAIRAVNDEWFAVAIESRTDSDAIAMAPAVSALPGLRQFWYRSADADILVPGDTTSIAYTFSSAGYDQARVVYHSQAAVLYPDMAMMGRVLPIPESRDSGPGSAAWHDQPIIGIPGDSFTSAQRAAIEAVNAEFFISVAGATRAQGGKMAGGEWGDIMHFLAWLETRMAEDGYLLMAQSADRRQKVAYTDQGIAQVESIVRNRLDLGVSIGGITDDYTVTVPRRADTSSADRAARILRDVTFTANLQGAIKFMIISGAVAV